MERIKITVKQEKNSPTAIVSFECDSLKAGLIINTIADEHDIEVFVEGVQASIASIASSK